MHNHQYSKHFSFIRNISNDVLVELRTQDEIAALEKENDGLLKEILG